MNNKAFSKIGILIILIIIIGGGVFAWQYFIEPEEEVKTLEEEIIPTEDETADLSSEDLTTEDWQTYRNEEYGFEVKYPNDWLVEGNQDSVYFKRTDISQGEIEEKQIGYPLSILIENTSRESILDWFENKFSDRAQNLRPEKKIITIGGIKGINYSDPVSIGGCDEIFAIIKNGNLFRFLRHGSTCDYSDKLFTNIISTFRFLE